MSKSRKNNKKLNKKRKPASKIKMFFKTCLVTFVILTVVFIAGGVAYTLTVAPPTIPSIEPPDEHLNYGFIQGEWNEDDHAVDGRRAPYGFTDSDRKDDFFTFLIIGLDNGVNTDTIMVASYDGANREANIISIPRDSLVNVSRRVKKINAAFPSGTLNGGGRAGGIDQLRREVSTIIGFMPDFYVIIDMEAFIRIIDAIGGVYVYVPFNMRYFDPTEGLRIDIQRGSQHLNGAQALHFARFRLGGAGSRTISDYQRIENQQAIIHAALESLLRPASLLRIPEFLRIFNDNVHSDITAGNMIWFADELRELRGTDALKTHTLPTTGTSGLPMFYEFLCEEGILELVNRTVNPFTRNIESNDIDIIRNYRF